jgi:hypothetical protein
LKQKLERNEYRVHSQVIVSLFSEEKILTEKTQQGGRFRKLLLDAVEEGLSTLGETPKQAIYFHLQESFNIMKQDIPDKIDEFAFAIEKIFGEGAKLLEIQIMRSLHEKTRDPLKQYPKKEGLSFTRYVQAHETLRAR